MVGGRGGLGWGRGDAHMVPVRDMPKARTFIGTGRGETGGRASISILGDILGQAHSTIYHEDTPVKKRLPGCATRDDDFGLWRFFFSLDFENGAGTLCMH